jgi:hypothetical protein
MRRGALLKGLMDDPFMKVQRLVHHLVQWQNPCFSLVQPNGFYFFIFKIFFLLLLLFSGNLVF